MSRDQITRRDWLKLTGGFAMGTVAAGGIVNARAAEAVLAGAAPDRAVFRRAAEAALADATPSGANGFKIELANRIVTRALALAAAGTPERVPALPASPFAVSTGVLLDA